MTCWTLSVSFNRRGSKEGRTGTSDVGSATDRTEHCYPVSASYGCAGEYLLYDIDVYMYRLILLYYREGERGFGGFKSTDTG